MDEKSIDQTTDEFNAVAAELQATEFRRPRTPGEWQKMAKDPRVPDYAMLIKAVVPLLNAFQGLSQFVDRMAFPEKLTADARGILRTFAHAASILAVRWDEPHLVAQGLTALAILGGVDDVRDLTFYLATLHHSAVKLRIDVVSLFDEKAALSSSMDLQDMMRAFPLRAPVDRDIRAFRLQETIGRSGFDYLSV